VEPRSARTCTPSVRCAVLHQTRSNSLGKPASLPAAWVVRQRWSIPAFPDSRSQRTAERFGTAPAPTKVVVIARTPNQSTARATLSIQFEIENGFARSFFSASRNYEKDTLPQKAAARTLPLIWEAKWIVDVIHATCDFLINFRVDDAFSHATTARRRTLCAKLPRSFRTISVSRGVSGELGRLAITLRYGHTHTDRRWINRARNRGRWTWAGDRGLKFPSDFDTQLVSSCPEAARLGWLRK